MFAVISSYGALGQLGRSNSGGDPSGSYVVAQILGTLVGVVGGVLTVYRPVTGLTRRCGRRRSAGLRPALIARPASSRDIMVRARSRDPDTVRQNPNN